jgi:hypothetical protein
MLRLSTQSGTNRQAHLLAYWGESPLQYSGLGKLNYLIAISIRDMFGLLHFVRSFRVRSNNFNPGEVRRCHLLRFPYGQRLV